MKWPIFVSMPCLKRTLLPLFVIALLFSCRKPVSVNWDVDLTLPIVNARLDIRNFFGDTLVDADPTGLLHIVIDQEMYSVKLDSLFQLPDTTITESFTFQAFGLVVQPGQTFTLFPPTELEFKFGNDVALKRFDVRSGLLEVSFSNDLTQVLDLDYVIPNAKKNGQPLHISESIPPGQNSLLRQYDLSGYTLDMRGLKGDKYNTISQSYTLGLNPNASSVIVNYAQGAKVRLTYSEIVPQYIEGYFGQQDLNIALDTANFNIGNTFKAKNFMLDEVNMNFYLKNEFGAELSAKLDSIFSINDEEGNTVPLQSSQLSAINLNRASRSGSVIFPSIKPLYFNNGNSNVAPFVSNLPDKITYKGEVQLNPLGNISGYNDFAYYNTGLRIWADIDIPMRYNADYFLLKSGGDFNIGNTEQLDRVNGGQLMVYSENGFPFQAKLQAYLFDGNGFLIDSLFNEGNNVIPAGSLNAQNDVVSPVSSQLVIQADRATLESLKKAKRVEIKTQLLMPPNPPLIKLYDKYKFNIRIVGEFNYNVEI